MGATPSPAVAVPTDTTTPTASEPTAPTNTEATPSVPISNLGTSLLTPTTPIPHTVTAEAAADLLAEQEKELQLAELEYQWALNKARLAELRAKTAAAEASTRASNLVVTLAATPSPAPSPSVEAPPASSFPRGGSSPDQPYPVANTPASPVPEGDTRETFYQDTSGSPPRATLRASLLPPLPPSTSVAISSLPFPAEKRLQDVDRESLMRFSKSMREYYASNPTAAQAVHPAQHVDPIKYGLLATMMGLGHNALFPTQCPLSAEEFLEKVDSLARPTEGAFPTQAYAVVAQLNKDGKQGTRAATILSAEIFMDTSKRAPFYQKFGQALSAFYFNWVHDPQAAVAINPMALQLDLLPSATNSAARWILAAHLFSFPELKGFFQDPPGPGSVRLVAGPDLPESLQGYPGHLQVSLKLLEMGTKPHLHSNFSNYITTYSNVASDSGGGGSSSHNQEWEKAERRDRHKKEKGKPTNTTDSGSGGGGGGGGGSGGGGGGGRGRDQPPPQPLSDAEKAAMRTTTYDAKESTPQCPHCKKDNPRHKPQYCSRNPAQAAPPAGYPSGPAYRTHFPGYPGFISKEEFTRYLAGRNSRSN